MTEASTEQAPPPAAGETNNVAAAAETAKTKPTEGEASSKETNAKNSMQTSPAAKAEGASAQTHSSPKKRRKVNHGKYGPTVAPGYRPALPFARGLKARCWFCCPHVQRVSTAGVRWAPSFPLLRCPWAHITWTFCASSQPRTTKVIWGLRCWR